MFPEAVSVPDEVISAFSVPVTVLCAERFTVPASKSISDAVSAPVISAVEPEALTVSLLSAPSKPETFIPVFSAFTVVFPPDNRPETVVFPPVFVTVSSALFLISAPCAICMPLLPELLKLRFIPFKSPVAVFVKEIPPVAVSFFIFNPGTGTPPAASLSPPSLPAIVTEPAPDLFSIFISE